MEKITIKELIEFRKKGSEKTKRNFALKLKTRKAKVKDSEDKSGGNYWSISNSSIYNTFKRGKDEFYDEKIDEVTDKYSKTTSLKDKTMYERNLDILRNFKELDILSLRPDHIINFETVERTSKIISLQNLPIYINPNLVFIFEENGTETIGGIILVPQLNGFTKTELGLFCEILYKFLFDKYSGEYSISQQYCIAIDTYNASSVTYHEMINTRIPSILNSTLLEIKNI
ncbi:hypothetical protein H1R17_10065 [Flavobacterium sp. xlx-214]|uniref:hypothetical protein n=1 Tax=unclassified Flavobacterium TaxID=196869 RepID=UPI0013D12AD5|nr:MULTISPECIES: hypothetical protein [unclassified Flavobacterium]MBA5791558.1 hypothetical protein [Flavobacterium sp. xlx-221]QMI82809.1 hypothetical protein H1R17_10065 [Flavobacterium sp. xlx-214]